ncbi:hypothetical protein C6P88_21720 [Burkholderia contaminans]|nr:hypothetical protein C6P88_21720 [Burkholderia contaminans]
MVHRRNIYGIVIWCFLFDQCPDMKECYRVLSRSAGRKTRARKGGQTGRRHPYSSVVRVARLSRTDGPHRPVRRRVSRFPMRIARRVRA